MSIAMRVYLILVLTLVVAMIPVAFLLTWMFPIGFPRLIENFFEKYNWMLDVYNDVGVDSRDRF